MAEATDTSERGLERLVCTALAGHPCDPRKEGRAAEAPAGYGGVGWLGGSPHDYDREFCVDRVQLAAFLHATQAEAAESLALNEDGPTRRKFLARLQGEISKRGTIDVVRHGVKHGAHNLELFYGTPSAGNPQAQERFAQNRFTVVRQLRYSRDDTQRALDIGLFINGLPVFTFELKNSLTKQTVSDAVEQYKKDRNPREKLFELGRCVAHFAVDESEVRFCTHLKGKASWFLPFNRGWNDGAGNPPNPSGIKTDYLWRQVLARESLTNILENYAQVVAAKDEKTGKKKRTQVWPRYHQLDVVRRLLADAAAHGAGRCYLIQHSAGSGKSNSIAWLAHQLIGLAKDDAPVFNSIIVVTDRLILDRQIGDTIHQYVQVGATEGRAQQSGDLRKFIEAGKKIIISTVQKFPFILDEIGNEQRNRRFAIIIDEAHSSQGGRTSASISAALGKAGEQGEDETYEDQINRVMESRKLLPNASYFAFTATPKNKTLEIFGAPDPQPDGAIRHRAFHSYTMKQAIQEGFILDVLAHYTPVASYYRLAKTVEDDPEFDVQKAQKKLRRFVEGHDHAIRLKAEIMVDHFREQVLAKNKIGGAARAMVVTNGIERAIQYFHAIRDYLHVRKSPYRAAVAFSGEPEFGGQKVTEASLNGFPSGQIAQKIQEDPYRFLVCADKFQTGYDEPLLHTMYVDKTLSGIKAVQTLSRLNRAHPKKHDVFVLDFLNDADTIRDAFADFYRATILAGETDPDKLHDLQADLDAAQVYSPEQIDDLVERYLAGAERDELDPILDVCVTVYVHELDEDAQVDFKGKAKAFVRTYGFLSCVLPDTNADVGEALDLPELPDLEAAGARRGGPVQGHPRRHRHGQLPRREAGGAEDPAARRGRRRSSRCRPAAGATGRSPSLDRLSNILQSVQRSVRLHRLGRPRPRRRADHQDDPRQGRRGRRLPERPKENSDDANARIEHDKVLARIVTGMVKDDAELFKQFMDNEDFKRWMTARVFELACEQASPL